MAAKKEADKAPVRLMVHVPRVHFGDACAMSWEALKADPRFTCRPVHMQVDTAVFREAAGNERGGPYLYYQGWTALS